MAIKKKIVESLSEEQVRILAKAAPAVNHQVGGEFTRIETAARKEILLRAAPHARQPSMLWTKDRKLKKKFFVKRHLEFLDQFECEFADRASRVLGEVDRELDLAGSNDVYFNVRCEESSLFFHLPRRAISSRNGFLIVRLPKNLYEVQRRAQLRYRTNGSEGFQILSPDFQAWPAPPTILDFSSGGVGVQVKFPSVVDAAAFEIPAGARFRFHVNFGVFAFAAEGEVRYVRQGNDDETGEPVVRIGLRFVGLSQDTVEAVQLVVLERSYARLREIFSD